METALILVLALILKIVSVQIENQKRREAERERRREETETARQEEAPVRVTKRKLPFEIPEMREADPNAETRLPQAQKLL